MVLTLFLAFAVVLVAFGGLLAAVDAAVTTLSRGELVALAGESRAGTSIAAIARDVGAHVNAVNFLRILAETSAAVLVTLAFAELIASPWLVLLVAAVVMTGVSFVLVGASPRTVGRAHPREVLRIAAPVARGGRLLMGPIADALTWLGNVVTPGRQRSAVFASEEQLLSMVDEAAALDVLDDDDKSLIHSIFEWSETAVREVMVARTDMVTIDDDASPRKAMRLFLDRGLSRVPVTHGDPDEIIGVLHLRDVARALQEGTKARGTAAALARPVLFVPDSKTADETLREMQQASNHLAMVVDEYGGIAGLVTMEDLIEELVGEISDESDRDAVEVVSLGAAGFLVPARLPLDELGALFGLDVDDDDVETVGGLLTKQLGRLPVVGDSAVASGLLLTAAKAEGRRGGLTSVRVARDPQASESGGPPARDPADRTAHGAGE